MTEQIDPQQNNFRTKLIIPVIKEELVKETNTKRKEIRIKWKKKRSLQTSLYEDQEQASIEVNPKLDPKRAAKIFKTAQLTTEMMSELPERSKKGAMNLVDVPVPREGLELQYQNISDPVTVENLF